MEQMVWRRDKIAELGFVKFKQEYPATATEAFQNPDHDSYIDSADVVRARKASLEEAGPLIVGVDPSRFGDDLFVVCWRRGRKVRKFEDKKKIDTVAAANWLKQIIDNDEPKKMFIDAGGGGAQIYDVLVSFGVKYRDCAVLVNFGGSPEEPELKLDSGEVRPGPLNRRAEMWMRSRDWLRAEGGADIPDMDALQSDATAPKYTHNVQQRLQLESKESMRRRKVPSPDHWDALALTFASSVYDETQAKDYGARQARKQAKPRGRSGWMRR